MEFMKNVTPKFVSGHVSRIKFHSSKEHYFYSFSAPQNNRLRRPTPSQKRNPFLFCLLANSSLYLSSSGSVLSDNRSSGPAPRYRPSPDSGYSCPQVFSLFPSALVYSNMPPNSRASYSPISPPNSRASSSSSAAYVSFGVCGNSSVNTRAIQGGPHDPYPLTIAKLKKNLIFFIIC